MEQTTSENQRPSSCQAGRWLRYFSSMKRSGSATIPGGSAAARSLTVGALFPGQAWEAWGAERTVGWRTRTVLTDRGRACAGLANSQRRCEFGALDDLAAAARWQAGAYGSDEIGRIGRSRRECRPDPAEQGGLDAGQWPPALAAGRWAARAASCRRDACAPGTSTATAGGPNWRQTCDMTCDKLATTQKALAQLALTR